MSWRFVVRDGLLDRVAAVLAAPRPGPLVFTGETGIGRSTVLELAAGLVDERTDALIPLRGTPGRLATLREHLPPDVPVPRAGGLGVVVEALERHADGRRPVVLLDDAHLADHATVQVLRDLHVRTGAVLVLALRTDRFPGPDPLDCLRYEPGFQRVEVPPMGVDEVASLASDVLGGPVSAAAAEALRAVTGGNPALLRRYLTAGALRAAMRQGESPGLSLGDVPHEGVELDERGRERLREAVRDAWRELSLDVLDQACRLALLAGEEAAVSLVWPQVLLLRGNAREALAQVRETGAAPSEARALTRAFVLAFGPEGTDKACALLDDVARTTPAWASRLDAVRAWLLAVGGDTAEARQVVADLVPDRQAAVFAQAALATVALAENRPTQAVSALRRALTGAERMRDELPWLAPYLTACLVDGLVLAGRLAEATWTAAQLRAHAGHWEAAVSLGACAETVFQRVGSR
ncbi:ATP-binding protein [Saccharothrix syringae]|uniref:ATP-binding protein n=1 Tax=Saccharothrix syringae TaxID=103733 RepID=A0A5Q0H4A9_SACSY|nr:ATP-binding protein [Saccharothrix syringae]QFZ20969.1 ATP-binding protein [Saccharothrix syringae]